MKIEIDDVCVFAVQRMGEELARMDYGEQNYAYDYLVENGEGNEMTLWELALGVLAHVENAILKNGENYNED